VILCTFIACKKDDRQKIQYGAKIIGNWNWVTKTHHRFVNDTTSSRWTVVGFADTTILRFEKGGRVKSNLKYVAPDYQYYWIENNTLTLISSPEAPKETYSIKELTDHSLIMQGSTIISANVREEIECVLKR
jgi:hypothetical protein